MSVLRVYRWSEPTTLGPKPTNPKRHKQLCEGLGFRVDESPGCAFLSGTGAALSASSASVFAAAPPEGQATPTAPESWCPWLLGGSRDIVSQVISTLIWVISKYNYSNLFYNLSYYAP